MKYTESSGAVNKDGDPGENRLFLGCFKITNQTTTYIETTQKVSIFTRFTIMGVVAPSWAAWGLYVFRD